MGHECGLTFGEKPGILPFFLGACEITAPEIDGGKRKRKEKSAETTKQKRKRRKERKCEGKPREGQGKKKKNIFTRATI